MTNVFSAISGQFNKAVLLGASLPVTVFVILWLILIEPLFPPNTSLLLQLGVFGTGWQVAAVTFVTVILTSLLFVLNIPLIRLFEGYPWKDTLIGKWRTRAQKAKFFTMDAKVKGMRTLLRALPATDPDYKLIRAEWSRLNRQLLTEFPAKDTSVLPTRLGNTIRSFESYPQAQYEMEAITLWTRLIAKIDKEYAAVLSDAKTGFDFMLNSSALSALFALALLAAGLAYPTSLLASPARAIPWLLEIVFFAFLAGWFYSISVSRAAAWGEMVKSAFDLFRWDLLKQLGYTQSPKTRPAERALWDKISSQIIYGDQPEGPRVDYAEPAGSKPPCFVTCSLPDAVKLTRGVRRGKNPHDLGIVLEIKNTDPKQTAQDVVLVETLPANTDYRWGSAACNGAATPVEGANPYRFQLPNLGPGKTLQVTFRLILRDTQD